MPGTTRRVLLVLFAFVVPLGATAQSGQALVVRATALPCLTIRTTPAADANTVACLSPGTTVKGLATAPYWRRIQMSDGKKGWAAKKFLAAPDSATGTTPSTNASTDIPEDAWLEIHFVDVGSGDGIWIHTYDDGVPGNGRFEGKNIVIDGGPQGGETNVFLKYLQAKAHPNAVIDALFVSHPHDDHYPGAGSVISHFDVCDYYDNGYNPGGSKYTSYLAIVATGHCRGGPMPVHSGRANFGTFDLGSEIKLEVLYAYPGSDDGLGAKGTLINSGSIVLKLTYGTQSFLFMGDLEGKDKDATPDHLDFGEKKLLADPSARAKLKSTLIKAGHHGSETSSTDSLINLVDPRYVIISSGRRNFNTKGGESYLPDISTLERWCAHNPAIRIYRTDQDDEAEGRTRTTDKDGDHIVVKTNGKVVLVEALSAGHPYSPTSCSP